MSKMKYQTEEQKELMKFGLVLVILIGVIGAVYVFSRFLIKPNVKDYEYTSGSVSTSAISVGTMLSKPEDEYYVLAYDFGGSMASSYNTYGSYYTANKSSALKIYYLDLSNAFNSNFYVKDKSNPKAKKVKDLKMLDGTLIRVKNGSIVSYVEGAEAISKALKV